MWVVLFERILILGEVFLKEVGVRGWGLRMVEEEINFEGSEYFRFSDVL